MRPPHLALRLTLAVAGLAPLLYGVAALLDGTLVADTTWTLSRGSLVMTPELDYARKPLGLYVAMSGGLLLYTIVDPVRYRAVITWGALLLLARGLQRLLLTGDLHALFGIPLALNVLHAGYLCTLSLVLLALRPRGKRA